MTVPTWDEFMLPVLRTCSDGNEHAMAELRPKVAGLMKLSSSQLEELTPGGKQTLFDNRVGWAKWHLHKAALLQRVRRGVFVISDRGRELLAKNPATMTLETLMQYPDFAAFIHSMRDGGKEDEAEAAPVTVQATQTPQESLELAYRELRRKVEDELLESVRAGTPRFFEEVVVDLLIKMGYGGTRTDAGRAIGKSGDGGIDGVIKEDHLGLDVVYVQAKRWEATVGRPEIQSFAGSLEGARARKGVFITTSGFASTARDYVDRIDKRIVLIDGEMLAKLMFDFGLGVTTAATYEVKRVDSDYFDEQG